MRRRFGQHFLSNLSFLEFLIQEAHLDQETAVLEIGPGQGALTTHLLRHAGSVLAVELDRTLFQNLQEKLAGYREHLILYPGNILKGSQLNPEVVKIFMFLKARSRKVVSSPPYYCIRSLILALLTTPHWQVDDIVLVVPEVVALRLKAPPGQTGYGVLSVAGQLFSKVRLIRSVSHTLFYPPPAIDSYLISLTPGLGLLAADFFLSLSLNPQAPSTTPFPMPKFIRFLFRLFSFRRKTLAASLLKLGSSKTELDSILDSVGVSPEIRIDQLPPRSILSLYLKLQLHQGGKK